MTSVQSIRLNDSTFNVLLMEHSGSLKTIGNITSSGYFDYESHQHEIDTSNINHQKNIIKIPIKSVYEFNKQLLEIIAIDCMHIYTKIRDRDLPVKLLQVEDITGSIFKILRYRRCTVYLVHQTSSRGERYLAYFSDKIVHSAECFGTDSTHVKRETIFDEILNSAHISKENLETKFGI